MQNKDDVSEGIDIETYALRISNVKKCLEAYENRIMNVENVQKSTENLEIYSKDQSKF
jgi:hypothetical protein